MAKGIGSYKGVWNKADGSVAASELPVVAVSTTSSADPEKSPEPPVSATFNATNTLPPALLEHRYQMLVLQEHRHKLGRDLLDAGHQDPWQVAFALLSSFGKSFRPWAHGRFFAMGCYLGIDMSPEVLRQLRHPLQFGRYRRSMDGLWRLLDMLARRCGQKPLPQFAFRLLVVFPPLGVLVYEKQLQALMAKAYGFTEAANSPTFATSQGQ